MPFNTTSDGGQKDGTVRHAVANGFQTDRDDQTSGAFFGVVLGYSFQEHDASISSQELFAALPEVTSAAVPSSVGRSDAWK